MVAYNFGVAKMMKVKYILIITIFLFIGIDVTLEHRHSFGEECSFSYDCESSEYTVCRNKTCSCLKEDTMSFNETIQKCVVLSGERCIFDLVYNSDGSVWSEKFVCVDHAICDEKGVCKCDNETYENSEQRCVPKKLIRETCSRNEECSDKENLVCVEGQCVCNTTISIFDHASSTCVGRVGQSCVKFGGCTRNAFCPFQETKVMMEKTKENTECRCKSGYISSKNGICLGKRQSVECHGKYSPCVTGLICSNNKCECPFPELQTFNKTLEKCVSHLYGPCYDYEDEAKVEFPCESNAECKSASPNDFPECLCMRGYIESKGGHCKRPFGGPCSSYLDCDQVTGLTCRNGKCSCGDLHEYDKANGICRGLVGARCPKGKRDACIDGAVCQPVRDDEEVKGVCRCIPTYQMDTKRRCNDEKNSISDELDY